jgi:hypothetical protein
LHSLCERQAARSPVSLSVRTRTATARRGRDARSSTRSASGEGAKQMRACAPERERVSVVREHVPAEADDRHCEKGSLPESSWDRLSRRRDPATPSDRTHPVDRRSQRIDCERQLRDPLREGVYADARSGVVLVYRDHRIDSIGIYGGDTEDAVSTDFPDAKVEHKDGLWEFAIGSRDNPPWGRGHWSDDNTVTGRLFLELRPRATSQIDFHADWVSK